ncbi:inositol polyphosphate 5-phosphatase [Linnemannia schmuckeri]|uniref:phosphoinositide 5-phosphatase n=1 Tax=Linnemannia schmuckeri TaxID=64567 RepID=A0A9P5V719_9FUNG|nr:inositol polyphosphate 5-phosphatase [Linnemannia schmuckeri]
MQSEVYLSSHGQAARTIALRPCGTNRLDPSSQGNILYFSPHDEHTQTGLLKVAVRLEPAADFHQGFYRKVHSRPVYGCLGLMHHANDTFIALVTGCTKVGDLRMSESVYKIIAVKFFSLTGETPDEDMIPAPVNPEYASDTEGPGLMPHPCRELEKVLCNGGFYFSPQFDLTRSIQSRQEKHSAETNQNYDQSYLWNHFMLSELLTFRSHLDEQEREELDFGGLLVHVIQGYVGCQPFRTATTQGQISVISRLSSRRAGTRYNTRGIDDNGNVANFVETETILSNPEWCFAYTQIRGSVPVFWEQQGLQLASHKIQLSRGSDATKPAVKRHFEELIQKYEDVHIIDLLGIKDQGEITLSQEYRGQVEALKPILKHLHMTRFDYHSQVKGGNYEQVQSLLQHIRGDSERYGYFYHDLLSNSIIQTQRGVFRTNCLDCLDRTNVIQSSLSREATEYLIHNLFPQDSRFSSLMAIHSQLWADNGDMLSKIYTGTGALKSDVTRSGKMSFASMLGDATKSINRFYINNFQDKDRQEVIDILLGKMSHQSPVTIYDPVHDSIASEVKARLGEYSQKVQIDVFVGTYNLNGKPPSEETLEPWLCFDKDVPEPDLYVIGFQEIVKLTPKQIMATDEGKRRVWEHEIERTINRRGGARYAQLRSGQLVGAALMIYAKESSLPHIRNVECAIKKTGMGGMAGNKGAVAIRMNYYETELCLVTSHLASGQDNLQERNNDFHTINNGLTFARGRNIASHDIILWCGDFNYRVDMENDQIRALVSQGNYFEIFRCDQLKRSIDYGEAFYGYKEGIIAFAPTYRYDIGTDNYDTSEKYRAPAWTDRILYKGRDIYQTSYDRAEFRTSDHRPVMSMFVLELTMLDSQAKEKMEQTLYRNSSARTVAIKEQQPAGNGFTRDVELGGKLIASNQFVMPYDRVPQSTGQKPSSESHQWWNDPLEGTVKRIPSNKKNPFEGDKTITDTNGASPKAVPPRQGAGSPIPSSLASRPAPSPPARKPTVDLLGDIDDSSPVLPIMSPTAGREPSSNGTISPLPSVKKYAPPPPASRRTGLPTILPASSVIHKDGAFRRPAPPPPKKYGFLRGTEGNKQNGTEDDNDDDDDDDDTDAYVDAKSEPALVDIPTNPVVFKQDKTREIKEKQPQKEIVKKDESKADHPSPKLHEAETLFKPSQLKSHQPGTAGALFTSDKSTPVPNKIVEKKAVEFGIIRPTLSSASSISSNSSSTPPSSVSLATVAANKSKVLLPGLDPRGKGGSGRHPAIASMGLGLGSAGIETPSKSDSASESPSLPNVQQRTKEYNNKSAESESTTSSTAMTGGANVGLTGKIAPKVKNAMTMVNKEDKLEESTTSPPSVSELKKSFGSPTDNTSSKPVGGGISTPTGVKLASIDSTTPSAHTPGSDRQVLPVIPMVKPLSFAGSAGTTSVTKTVPAVSSVGVATKIGGSHHQHGAAANKIKMAGLGSPQAASIFKPSLADQEHQKLISSPTAATAKATTTTTTSGAGGAKKIVKSDGSVEDVKPASGSVKQAIAALKANTEAGTEEGSDGAGKKASARGDGEEAEDDKVDAFAFWKSK